MDRRGRKHGLCPKLYGAERGSGRCFHYQLHICQGACIKEEAPETYNTRAQQAINALSYGRADWESFLVVGAGRDEGEVSVVLVVNGLYQGYAYFEETALESGVESICASIPFKGEAPDVQRIIQTYIKRNPREVKPFLQVQES